MLKDDKSYPHQTVESPLLDYPPGQKDGGLYSGPYPDVGAPTKSSDYWLDSFENKN